MAWSKFTEMVSSIYSDGRWVAKDIKLIGFWVNSGIFTVVEVEWITAKEFFINHDPELER